MEGCQTLKKELSYFTINDEFGGNQDWFTNVVMHIGGCAAATACDSCIYFARQFKMEKLYPFDAWNLTKLEYVAFSQKMKPYLRPRIHGVNKLWMFTEGFGKYLHDVGVPFLKMEEFSGERSFEEAREFIREKIDQDIPVPYLMLNHKNRKEFEDFIWHWFLAVGYEEQESAADGRFLIRTATYGEETWLDLEKLWDTKEGQRGGLIGYKIA